MIESLARQLKLPLLAGFEQHIFKEDDFTGKLLHLLQLEVLDKSAGASNTGRRRPAFRTSASLMPSSSPKHLPN